ncbi:MAG: transcription termination factor NusB, partial [bacterium]
MEKIQENPRLTAFFDIQKWLTGGDILFQKRDLFENQSNYGLYQLIFSTVIRYRIKYEYIIKQLTRKKIKQLDSEVISCLMIGLAQFDTMEDTQEYAIIKETVELMALVQKPFFKGFVNANLRSFQREKEQIYEKLSKVKYFIQASHPE